MTRVLVVGDIAVDVLVAPHVPPVPGADVKARIRTLAGGAGANTAAWLAHLGVPVTLVARVGNDPAGAAAVADLAAAGVTTAVAVDPVLPTATVVALLSDGDRTLLSDRGAAAALVPADLPPLDGVRHVHVSGYVLLDPSSRPAGLAAIAAARAGGATVSVDPQVAPALDGTFLQLVRDVDLLLPNAAELDALGGLDTVLAVVGAVAWTDGPRGASWADARGRWTVPAPPAEVVDATGAGDAFDAGLLSAWLAGAGPEDALRAGCAAGAQAVVRPGARP
ncbi:carbohydrate kinase family protein [Pseudonocardia sp. CA-107938]|uniref:carbohydrate kinase family protein n=1 Tax=Pseudonocardia sp. CA-107938 TaxID=3240021 RepID=UPI003D904C74